MLLALPEELQLPKIRANSPKIQVRPRSYTPNASQEQLLGAFGAQLLADTEQEPPKAGSRHWVTKYIIPRKFGSGEMLGARSCPTILHGVLCDSAGTAREGRGGVKRGKVSLVPHFPCHPIEAMAKGEQIKCPTSRGSIVRCVACKFFQPLEAARRFCARFLEVGCSGARCPSCSLVPVRANCLVV